MNLGLDLFQKQQQKLSFNMIQSLKLLQINTLQLEQLVRTEIEINPVLETVEEIEDVQLDEKDEAEDELAVSEDEIDWDEYLDEGFDLGYTHSDEYEAPDPDTREATIKRNESLEEYLMRQLDERKLSEEIKLLVSFLIFALDPDGYLRIPLEQIVEDAGVDILAAEEALYVLQSMEPVGVGGRDLREVLLIQMRKLEPDDSLAVRILSEGWDLFSELKVPMLANRFSVSPSEVQAQIEKIKKLNPKPGYVINSEPPDVITPDLIVEKIDDEYVVTLNDASMPSLFISSAYRDMLKRGSNVEKDVKNYVREKFNSATWLIKAIEQRKTTMLKVMYAIIERQYDFFEQGKDFLKPLRQQDIADMVDMHISTISRVVNGKYVETSHGIFELKFFFSESLGQTEKGDDISTKVIKEKLISFIEEEDKRKPLSDQKLANMLTGAGFSVARRTVAKYREQAKIPPARMRKIYE